MNKLIASMTTVIALAAAAPAAEAKVNIRWEKITVPFQDDGATTAKGSSAVVSLGKLGRVE